MKWQPTHKRKKLGLALLEEERAQEIATAGLKELFENPEVNTELNPGIEPPELKPEVKIESNRG